MSASGPEQAGPADWERVDWAALRDELAATVALAGELRLWTVLGSVHRLAPPHRPHNSLYVISDRGTIATRYDERMLSSTKVNYLYTPGSVPVIFDVDGVPFGCALGMEATFPEVFLEYERLDVDGVLFSTHGPGTPDNNGPFALQAQAHAASNSYWVSYAGTTQDAASASSGVISPDGEWIARCPRDATSSIAVADLHTSAENRARSWRRAARGGIYDRISSPTTHEARTRVPFSLPATPRPWSDSSTDKHRTAGQQVRTAVARSDTGFIPTASDCRGPSGMRRRGGVTLYGA